VIESLGTTLVAIASSWWIAPAEPPPLQRPNVVAPAGDTAEPAPAEPAPTDAPADAAPTDVTSEPAPTDAPSEPVPTDAPSEPEPTDVAAEPEPEPGEGELRVAAERPGPPYYVETDLAELRTRHGVEAASPPPGEPARWRCLIADPTCRHSFEVHAMGAYAYRARQGDVSRGTVDRWHSARAQYDFWLSLPALVETEGKNRYTRMSMGPKGGVVISDTGDLWGNLGIATRYWLGRGRWAPNIEITSALTFKLATREAMGDAAAERFRMQRGPVGFQADVGFGLGGFGAIVVGGQYDSPLAREDVSEQYRVVSSGMFFVGFRGNILWGGPALAAVAAHGSTRAVQRP
jgi:hypothetical protein